MLGDYPVFSKLRIPIKSGVFVKKGDVVQDDFSAKSFQVVIIHHDEIKVQEISIVDAKFEEILVFGIPGQTGRKLPALCMLHHGNRKGLADLLTSDHGAVLRLLTMDHDASTFGS